MVQGDLESTNPNYVKSCPYPPNKTPIKLYPDEGQSSIDAYNGGVLASISDAKSEISTHTDNQSIKHVLEQVDENSELDSNKDNKPIRSPMKENKSAKFDLEKLSSLQPNIIKPNQVIIEDQVYLHSQKINHNQFCLKKQKSSHSDSYSVGSMKASSPILMLDNEETNDQTPKNVYVNVENNQPSSTLSTTTTLSQLKANKSDYI